MNIMIKRITLLFTCLIGMVIFGVGCGGVVDQSQKTATERKPTGTISFTEKDPEKGILRGTYTLDGYTIKFEAIRGQKNPPLSKIIDPESPEYAVDGRFCDGEGYCFANALGGHAFANSDWIKEKETEPTQSESLENNKALWAFHQDLQLLRQTDVLKDFPDELEMLDGLSNMPSPYPLQQSKSEGTSCKDVLSLSATFSSSSYTHVFEIWRKAALGLGDHSATRSFAMDSVNIIRNQVITANHGTFAATSSMILKCNRPFTGRTVALPIQNDCNTPISPASASMHSNPVGCCSTAYSFFPGGHVCNDDSRIQRDVMIANGPISASYCSDWMLQGWAPNCS
jgi:hypothetical protein